MNDEDCDTANLAPLYCTECGELLAYTRADDTGFNMLVRCIQHAQPATKPRAHTKPGQ